jgi:flagellar capping protein FliD
MLDKLRSGVTSAVPGFLSGSDEFTLASEIGLEFGTKDSSGLAVFEDIGKMFLDTSTLNEALSTDYRAVLNLIGGSGTGVSDIDDVQFAASSDMTEGGVYDVRIDFSQTGSVSLAMIKKTGESIWRNLTVSGDKLTGIEGEPEEDLELTAVWDGSGAYTANAEVRVRQGFANVLYDRASSLLDSVTGVLTTKRRQYESAIEGVEKNIEFQEGLLEKKEMYLREKYARMETAMAKLDSQRAAFDAMFASLDSMSKSKEE